MDDELRNAIDKALLAELRPNSVLAPLLRANKPEWMRDAGRAYNAATAERKCHDCGHNAWLHSSVYRRVDGDYGSYKNELFRQYAGGCTKVTKDVRCTCKKFHGTQLDLDLDALVEGL